MLQGDGLALRDIIGGSVNDPVRIPLGDARMLVPLDTSARVFCVGRNFGAHADEMGGERTEQPNFFVRLPSSFVANGDELAYPEGVGTYDFEGEIAFVLGIGGRAMDVATARAAIFGATLLMDGSVRSVQKSSLFLGKNFDGSGALGPCIVQLPPDLDLRQLRFTTALNGTQVQSGCLADTIYSPEALVSRLSAVLELRPGDVISTGTPSGVGAARNPPSWLVPGDEITVTCEAIGQLRNKVAAIF
ncbi:MAG: fumarylacetoacetate hydrolase family protein [Novosphingobium sp.]